MAAKRRRARRAKGSGSIYQNADGTYTAALHIAGRLVRRRAADRPAAEARLAELQALARQSIDVHTAGQPLGTWLNSWYALALKRDVKPRTQEFYRSLIESYILPAIGHMSLDALRPGHIQDLIDRTRADIADAGRSPGIRTARAVAGLLKDALALAVERKLLAESPYRGIVLPRNRPSRVEPLSDRQLAALLSAAEGARTAALWHVMALLGLRRGEAMGLAWADYDAARGTLEVRQQVQVVDGQPTLTTPKTESSRRTLPVPAALARMFADHWQQQQAERRQRGLNWKEHGLMFPSNRGTPLWPRNLEAQFYRLRGAAGLPETVRLHHLRHTVATLLDEAGASEALKAGILGHGKVSITLHYTTARLDAMRRVLEAVAERILRKAA